MRSPACFLALTTAVICSSSHVARAQVPPGRAIVATFRGGAFGSAGLGGVFLVDPANPGVVQPITNLPPEITGSASPPGLASGPDWVVRRPSDGKLVVNGWQEGSGSVPVFILTLKGTAVSTFTRYNLGTITSYATTGNPAAVLLQDERVLVAIDLTGVNPAPPLQGAMFAIIDPSAPPLPVKVSPVPSGRINALDVDFDLGLAYFSMIDGFSLPSMTSQIYSVPLTGGTPRPIGPKMHPINGLVVEPDGNLLACGWTYSVATRVQGHLSRVDLATRKVTVFPQVAGLALMNGLEIDPVTGDLLFVQFLHLKGTTGSLYRLSPRTPTGTLTPLTAGPAGGWGVVSGVDLYPWLETYGSGRGCAGPFPWVLGPNPGGTPAVGNGGFSLTIGGSPAQTLFMAGVGRSSAVVPLGCPVELLTTTEVSLYTGTKIPLAIPNNPILRGLQVYTQTLNQGAGGFGSSAGLRVTIH